MRYKDAEEKAKDILQSIWKGLCRLGPVSLIVILIGLMIIAKVTGAIKEEKNFIYYSVSLLALALGFFNYFINKTKVNLDLFKIRYEVYQKCSSQLFESTHRFTRERENMDSLITDILRSENLHKAKLLFDDKTSQYIEMIEHDAMNLYKIKNEKNKATTDEESCNLENEEAILVASMIKKLEGLPLVFEKYMSFKHIF